MTGGAGDVCGGLAERNGPVGRVCDVGSRDLDHLELPKAEGGTPLRDTDRERSTRVRPGTA